MKEMNREMELNINELEQVNGGWTFCVVIGWSTGPEASGCFKEGYVADKDLDGFKEALCTSKGYSLTDCIYVGLGIGGAEQL